MDSGVKDGGERSIMNAYEQLLWDSERLHSNLLEFIKAELDRAGIDDINNIQALAISHMRSGRLSKVGSLVTSGCYYGTNASYNVKKLTENGYLDTVHEPGGRRVSIALTQKGIEMREMVRQLHEDCLNDLLEETYGRETFAATNALLKAISGNMAKRIESTTH